MTILNYFHHRSSIFHRYKFFHPHNSVFLKTEVWGYNGVGGRYKCFELWLNYLSQLLSGFVLQMYWKLNLQPGGINECVLRKNAPGGKGEQDWAVTTEASISLPFREHWSCSALQVCHLCPRRPGLPETPLRAALARWLPQRERAGQRGGGGLLRGASSRRKDSEPRSPVSPILQSTCLKYVFLRVSNYTSDGLNGVFQFINLKLFSQLFLTFGV